MKINRFYAAFMAAAVAVSAFGCGGASAVEPASEAGTEAAADTEVTTQAPAEEAAAGKTEEENSGNPARKYVGAYKQEDSEFFYLLIEVTDNIDGVVVTAAQMDPEKPYVQWVMNGKIDDSLKIGYTDGIKSEVHYTEEMSIEQSVIYSDGTGYVQIGEDGSVTWQDDKEDIAKGCRFVLDEELSKEVRARMEEQDIFRNPVLNWSGRYHDAENISRSMTITPSSDSTNKAGLTTTEISKKRRSYTRTAPERSHVTIPGIPLKLSGMMISLTAKTPCLNSITVTAIIPLTAQQAKQKTIIRTRKMNMLKRNSRPMRIWTK